MSDETKCFICQENEPTHIVNKRFKLCGNCLETLKAENRARNRIKRSLFHTDDRGIFTMTLGANLRPTDLDIQEIKP